MTEHTGSFSVAQVCHGTESHHVALLLALYNGADFIGAQLDSLTRQSHENWSLFVSDDGSTDGGPDVVRRYQAMNPLKEVRMLDGPRKGAAENFLSLLAHVPCHASHAAFCDQDDVWHADKLSHALRRLEQVEHGQPAMYCGRTEIADRMLSIKGLSPAFCRTPCFPNALVQSIAGGNTMLLNQAGLRRLQAMRPFAGSIISHDWWAYQVITATGGHVIFDEAPKVIYRQHGMNLVGENNSLRATCLRAGKLLKGRFRNWTSANVEALMPMRSDMTPEARRCFDLFTQARKATFVERLILLRKSGVFRQTRRGWISLWLAAALGKL